MPGTGYGSLSYLHCTLAEIAKHSDSRTERLSSPPEHRERGRRRERQRGRERGGREGERGERERERERERDWCSSGYPAKAPDATGSMLGLVGLVSDTRTGWDRIYLQLLYQYESTYNCP